MIQPTKHVPTNRSLLGVGATILQRLDHPRTVTSLWEEVRMNPAIGSFDRFSLVLSLLFAIGAIDWRSGRLWRTRT